MALIKHAQSSSRHEWEGCCSSDRFVALVVLSGWLGFTLIEQEPTGPDQTDGGSGETEIRASEGRG